MKEGEHFGKIPGCGEKPTLLKPGAEKLSFMFRLAPEYTVTERACPGEHREYQVICNLRSTRSSIVMGSGLGSCSTMETKYRYRKAEQTCPTCRKACIIKGKKEYGGGWLCFAKVGGCGAKFLDGDPTIENQNMGRVEHDNPADYYNCVTPDTKVLTLDLRWVPAGEIESGDMLIGVEENLTTEYARHFVVGEAIVHGYKLDPLYEITFEDGRIVRCNGEHQWLVKKVGLKGTEWVATQDIHKEIAERKGRPRAWTVMSVCTPWDEDRSKEAGYIAGLLDADGSLGMTQLYVMFAQQSNTVLALLQSGLTERGYKLGVNACKTEDELEQTLSKKQAYSLRVLGGFTEQLRLLGSIRPPRLLERWLTYIGQTQRRVEGRGSGTGHPVRIVSVEVIGEGEIVLLGTSCHTYIAEGLVCHNTVLKMAKKRAHVDAVLTTTAASDIFTQDIEDMNANGTIGTPPADAPVDQPKPPERKQAPPVPAEGQTVAGVKVKEVRTATGKSVKGPWTAYFVKFQDDTEAGTFSSTLGQIAQGLAGRDETCTVTVKPGKKPGTLELVDIDPDGMEPPVDEQTTFSK